MTVDNSKLNYYSGWEIDQLVTANRTAVGIGVSSVVTIPANMPPIPNYEVQFQIAGLSRWYQAGSYSTDGTLANLHKFSTYIQNGVIYINTDIAGTAKYFIWSDKVDY